MSAQTNELLLKKI